MADRMPASGSGVFHGTICTRGCASGRLDSVERIHASGAGSSIHSRTAMPRVARSLASRQQTPASPQLSITWQKMSHTGGVFVKVFMGILSQIRGGV